MKIRKEILPDLVKFSNDSMQHSTPVIRPLWMLDPDDHENQKISDQFLIGDQILVAPILHPGKTSRDVYLPKVLNKNPHDTPWYGVHNDKLYQGGIWIRDVKAGLDEVPYFTRYSHD